MKKKRLIVLLAFGLLLYTPSVGNAMHIMEGFLPIKWAIVWTLVSLPFLFLGFKNLSKVVRGDNNQKLLLGLAGGFVFVLSALKIPSVTGSCSHPTGVGLGSILFGPTVMSVIGFLVLLFQSLLLAHGGLTTLGANTFSMAIVGPLVSYGIYRLFRKKDGNNSIAIFLAAALGDLMTYIVTALQLSLAFPDASSGLIGSLTKFLSVFAVTQIPLAIVEGIITLIVINLLMDYRKEGVLKIERI